ncbi:MAG: hypothetical protein BGO98_23475 [Myxococcales bacterium 68-20]|nr:hypothetical protein [Myxococcales bacterium]OJY15640.1 MAG: hypothetical protein BGO98_23475 [Myxococcales bacterium 68-20]
MKNDDPWQLHGEGPALPLAEEELHRLVQGAVGRAYGTEQGPSSSVERTGATAARWLVGGLGLAACAVATWAIYGAATERSTAPGAGAGPATPAAAIAMETPASPAGALATNTDSPEVPIVDVQALPTVRLAADRAPRGNVVAPEASRDLLREANQLRAERRWGEAATLYRRVADARGGESTTAMLALASLRLEHQNDALEARRLYRAVVDAAPDGPLAEEARLGVAMACRALRDERGESAALRAFLGHHPSSLSATKAQQRLTELERAQKEVTP